MLLTRIAPSLAKITQTHLRYASCQSVFLKSVAGVNKISTSPIGKEPTSNLSSPFNFRSTDLTLCKCYSTKQPELPSKQELVNYFFKVSVVIIDLMYKITTWLWAMSKKHIIYNPSVQSNWKTFNRKLEEARKSNL